MEQDINLNRILKFSKILDNKGIEFAIIIQNADMYYFTGVIFQGYLVIQRNGEYSLHVIKPYERVKLKSDLSNINSIRSIKDLFTFFKKNWENRSLTAGMELDIVPYSTVEYFKKNTHNINYIDISREIRTLRSVKDPSEIQMISQAGKILADTFLEISDFIKPEITELQLAAHIEQFMRLSGHQGFLRVRKFNMEIYYGSLGNTQTVNYPTLFDGPVGNTGLYEAAPYFSGNVVIKKEDTVMVDIMAGYEGYMADATRTYHLGPENLVLKKRHEFCELISDMASKEMKPGAIPSEIYFKSLKMAEEYGYTDNYMGYQSNQVRFLGHGLGLEIDEFPVLARGFDSPLETGNVIAVEPKLFFKDGSVGIENTFEVTTSGGKNLIPLDNKIFFIN